MSDIRITKVQGSPFELRLDWSQLANGGLDEARELATAVYVALGTDRLADVDDVLPDPDSQDRRGWWADVDAEEIWDGWQIGTRAWLLTRAKITGVAAREGSTLARAEQYAREALQPLVEKRMATRVTAIAERVGKERIDVICTIYRGPVEEIELRWQLLWVEETVN